MFKIKITNLITLVQWLKQLPLDKEYTRERTRFIKMAEPYVSGLNKKRIDIVKKYANKDDDGEPIVIEIDGGRKEYDFNEDERKKAEKELEETLAEKVEIPLEGNSSKIKSIKEILDITSFEFSGQLANEYDEWCQAFEEIES